MADPPRQPGAEGLLQAEARGVNEQGACQVCRRHPLSLAVGVLVLVAAVVVIVVVAAKPGSGDGGGGGNKPLDCKIEACDKVYLPPGAQDCSRANCSQCEAGHAQMSDDKGIYCALSCPLENCAVQPPVARGTTDCNSVKPACERCNDGWELEVDSKTLEYTGRCRYSCTVAQMSQGCAPASCSPDGTCGRCVPGFLPVKGQAGAFLEANVEASCLKATHSVPMSFYMYRAQSSEDYPPDSCDLASAAGVMWYLHNEVVKYCPRHNNIIRVLRYNVTVFNPPANYAKQGSQFGHYVMFDSGQCTVEECNTNPRIWDQYGYMVGCQPQNPESSHYGKFAYWYSLPGACPSQQWNQKSVDCKAKEPGGNCDSPNSTTTCTWHAEPAGQVLVDELSGISNFDAFCAAGNIEYDPTTDHGKGNDFWDFKNNDTINAGRVAKLLRLFAKHYPTTDALATPDPLCDGW